VLALIAIPLAAVLFDDPFVALLMLRPTKDVLLVAGFRLRNGDVGLLPVLLAAIPLTVVAVWLFYALGRAYAKELADGDVPKLVARLIPPERIRHLTDALDKKGARVVLLGRLAAFPSVLLGAAAGASAMPPRRFFPVDALGATLSVVEVLVAGYLFGAAYSQAGPWLTATGIVMLVAFLVILGRALRTK
jgi:membrane-associated protein